MGADELDPGLDGEVGLRVRQQGPQPLSAGEFAPRRRDIAPAQGHARLRRADGSVLQPGLIQQRARLACQGLSLVPLVACHRHQRPFAQYLRDRIGRADFLSGSDGLVKDDVRAVEIAGEDVRDPLQEPGHRAHDARRRELSCGLIGVRVHLLDTMAAQQSAQRSGEALDGWVPARATSWERQRSTA